MSERLSAWWASLRIAFQDRTNFSSAESLAALCSYSHSVHFPVPVPVLWWHLSWSLSLASSIAWGQRTSVLASPGQIAPKCIHSLMPVQSRLLGCGACLCRPCARELCFRNRLPRGCRGFLTDKALDLSVSSAAIELTRRRSIWMREWSWPCGVQGIQILHQMSLHIHHWKVHWLYWSRSFWGSFRLRCISSS